MDLPMKPPNLSAEEFAAQFAALLSADQRAAFQTELGRVTVEQVIALYYALGDMRHDINGHIQLMSLPTEIIRDNLRKDPDRAENLIPMVLNQPDKVKQSLVDFSGTFEKCFSIQRERSGPVE